MQSGTIFASLRFTVGTALVCACLGGCALFQPHPLTDAERTAEATQDLNEVFSGQEPLVRALTLEDAFARAIAYNLDERVKLMEREVAERDFDISKFDLLPKVIASAGASTRDNVLAISRNSVVSGKH
jgi:multidrug efflux system outer membrane protein